ncbi:MAG: cell wall hydrolase/autolysin [uncultured bacterium]|nr:MAG: cell wall hydrolase/autolysin [uncultured bacterium]OGH13154.1 MAG: hypothetical protein A2687_05190 [Candidatus Levybacteria bacterium RIFCSPHIGHO2_01_FULL_38_26]
MKKSLFILTSLFIVILIVTNISFFKTSHQISGAPPYDPLDEQLPNNFDYPWLENWERPDGPPKVGLQVGHWKSEEVPDELRRLRNNTGSSGGGKSEWEVNYEIVEETKKILEENGIVVDVLPATIPPKYWADVFVSIHADGSLDPSKSGFKAAAPRRDMSGKANSLVEKMEMTYQETTSLPKDPNVSRNMRGYYAFSYWRYEHAVHPMTASAILETGFLTSASDRKIIVDNPQISAKGIAEGIMTYLESEGLLEL